MAEQPLSAELLRKLAEHAARMDRIADASVATITADVDELDGSGKVAHRLHSVSHTQQANGHTTTRVISATRDGADDRADAQKKADEQDRKSKARLSPFAVGNSLNYRFAVLGADSSDASLQRVSIAPVDSDHASMDVIAGEAVVDPATGECVRLSGHPSKLAMFVDRLEMSFEYTPRTTGGRMLSGMTMSFSGGVLFVRRQGNVRMRFEYAPRAP